MKEGYEIITNIPTGVNFVVVDNFTPINRVGMFGFFSDPGSHTYTVAIFKIKYK